MTLAGEKAELRKNVSERTAQLVELLSEIGPDIPEIARRLGQFKESVRYRYKEKILDKGFAVQAALDQERLGLKRIVFVADFSQDYLQYANAILSSMNELCYVVYFGKTLPDGNYVVHAAVPREHTDSFVQFIHTLKDKGLFSSLELFTFEWARNPPMRAGFYDFNIGRWDFDWSAIARQGYDDASRPVLQDTEKFDYSDLLILKELHLDANKSLTEIAKRLKINYKRLVWHYTNHVTPRGLIKSYRINWKGTRYDYKIEKALHRKHRYLPIVLLVKDIDEKERMNLMSRMNPLPFLWFEAVGKNYYADLEFPVDSITEALEYLETVLRPFKGRYSYYAIDDANALSFTISYQLYEESEGRWNFDSEKLLARFDNLLLKIKGES